MSKSPTVNTNPSNAPPAGGLIEWDAGWSAICDQGIAKLVQFLESGSADHQTSNSAKTGSAVQMADQTRAFRREKSLSNEAYSRLYTTVYNMCIQKGAHCHTARLYDGFCSFVRAYLGQCVRPALGLSVIQHQHNLKTRTSSASKKSKSNAKSSSKTNTTDSAVDCEDILTLEAVQASFERIFSSLNGSSGANQLAQGGLDLLCELDRRWKHFLLMKRWLVSFFQYLNRFYVKRKHKAPLGEVCVSLFREIIFDPIRQRAQEAILDQIDQDRMQQQHHQDQNASLLGHDVGGEQAEKRAVLRDVTQLWVDMGMGDLAVYRNHLETALLQRTRAFYSRLSADWLARLSCPEYLAHAEQVLGGERARLEHFLHASSEDALFRTLHDVLLVKPQKALLEKPTGMDQMLHNNRVQELQRLYRLYSAVKDDDASASTKNTKPSTITIASNNPNHPSQASQTSPPAQTQNQQHKNNSTSLGPLGALLHAHVVSVGSSLLEKHRQMAPKAESTVQFVPRLLDCHQRYASMVATCFGGHPVFLKALKVAFEAVVNPRDRTQATRYASVPEMLSQYCNMLLSKGGTGQRMQDHHVEAELERVVRVFSFLMDKDLFADFYRKQLSRRLLLGRSANDDHEKLLIGKLKMRCGAQFTSKLEGMVNDMRTAHEHQRNFQKYLAKAQVGLGLEFLPTVLTTGFWPKHQAVDIVLPAVMKHAQQHFERHYDSRFTHRNLTWVHALGSVTLDFQPANGKHYLLEVSVIQAGVLDELSHHSDQPLTIEALQKQVNISGDEMKRHLKGLVTKFKIVQKQPAQGYAPNHRLRLNPAFQHPKRFLKVPVAAAKSVETDSGERAQQLQQLSENRKHVVEACIVRIMKSRQRLDHNSLVSEVTSQLANRFIADPKLIKRRVEDLINRDYLERTDTKGVNGYTYLA